MRSRNKTGALYAIAHLKIVAGLTCWAVEAPRTVLATRSVLGQRCATRRRRRHARRCGTRLCEMDGSVCRLFGGGVSAQTVAALLLPSEAWGAREVPCRMSALLSIQVRQATAPAVIVDNTDVVLSVRVRACA